MPVTNRTPRVVTSTASKQKTQHKRLPGTTCGHILFVASGLVGAPTPEARAPPPHSSGGASPPRFALNAAGVSHPGIGGVYSHPTPLFREGAWGKVDGLQLSQNAHGAPRTRHAFHSMHCEPTHAIHTDTHTPMCNTCPRTPRTRHAFH